ncbi:hypothetical protein AAES_125946 [Amazona aestiva]|uniref:Uncharacterized protein n=1 Tax=Amazona aestiva TaxID=12930 RepID=A0A0Q3UR55_AMAAE|nr:hypothetical protein AAES_125946 [Amazona aestiva]
MAGHSSGGAGGQHPYSIVEEGTCGPGLSGNGTPGPMSRCFRVARIATNNRNTLGPGPCLPRPAQHCSEPQGENKVSGPDVRATDSAATPIPAMSVVATPTLTIDIAATPTLDTGTAADPKDQSMLFSVAPCTEEVDMKDSSCSKRGQSRTPQETEEEAEPEETS